MVSTLLDLLHHSLWTKPAIISQGYWRGPMERPTWPETEASFLIHVRSTWEMDSPVPGTPSDDYSPHSDILDCNVIQEPSSHIQITDPQNCKIINVCYFKTCWGNLLHKDPTYTWQKSEHVGLGQTTSHLKNWPEWLKNTKGLTNKKEFSTNNLDSVAAVKQQIWI